MLEDIVIKMIIRPNKLVKKEKISYRASEDPKRQA